MSRFGTYLGSRFDTISVRQGEKEIYYARFLFLYFEQTVEQIKKNVHLVVKILIINTNTVITLCIKYVVFIVSVHK